MEKLYNNIILNNDFSIEKTVKREQFFSQGFDMIFEKDGIRIYQLKETGQIVCEIRLSLGLCGDEIEIAQITDVHINFCLSEELEDEEVNYTRLCRKWLADGEALKPLDKSMDMAELFDQTVITGDILDYLSNGAIQLVQKHIFDKDPDAICTIGSHDITKQMQTGIENKLSEDERFKIIESFWPHDIYYYSKTLNNKLIIIGLNTALGKYYTVQVEKLKYDIEKARKEGKYILVFQHNPISTGNPNDIEVEPMLSVAPSNEKPRNFYNEGIGICNNPDEATKEVYRTITNSADVIKGVFCGHLHSFFKTDVIAFDSKGKETVIPQFNSLGNPYFNRVGTLTRIVIE